MGLNGIICDENLIHQCLPALILITAEAAPGRIQMIQDRRANHFDAADLSVFNKERLCHQDAGRPIEATECVGTAVRQSALVDGALVESHVRPHNASLLVHYRITPIVDVLDNKVVAQLELRQAIHGKSIDDVRGLVFCFNDTSASEIYSLSLHDALLL